jgi:hypothetical protein
MKRRFKVSFLFPGTNLLCRGSAAHQQADRIDEQRFAGARFAGQNGKSRLKPDVKLFDEGKIDNAQLGKHLASRNLRIERILP